MINKRIKDGRLRYLIKNTGLFALSNIGTKLISFLLLPLYTNVLSTSQYGLTDIVMTIGFLVAPILVLNISEGVMRFALDDDNNIDIVTNVGWICILLSLFIIMIFYPCIVTLISKEFALIISVYLLTSAWLQVFLSDLRGREKLLNYAIANILNTFLIAILNILLLVYLKLGVFGFFLSYIISNVVSSVYCVITAHATLSISKRAWDTNLFKKMLIYSLALIPNSFMWWIINASDRLMIAFFIGASANGIYGISYKIPNILSTVTSIFTQAWTFSAIKEHKRNDYDTFTNKVFYEYSIFVIALVMLIMIFVRPFLSIYVGKDFYSSWVYVPILLIGFSFMNIGTFLGTEYVVHKDNNGFLYSSLIGAGINIVLNLLLIPKCGLLGAAISTCFSYISIYLFRSLSIKKYIILRRNTSYKVSLALLIMVGLCTYIINYYVSAICQLMLLIFFIYINRSILQNVTKMASDMIGKRIKYEKYK